MKNTLNSLIACTLLSVAFAPALNAGTATEEKMAAPILETPPPGLKINGLIQLEFSDHYITPRGLNVENQGLVFQPLILLFWDLYSSEGFLNDISLTTGVWNSWHTRKSGATPRQWNEIDPIVGLTFKFAKAFQFDAFYTAFNSQTNSYDTSTNLDLKLTYHDSFIPGFSINPYVEYFYEISDKSTVNFGGSPESYYFVLGMNPTFQAGPVKLEFPTFANFVADDFYQRFDGTGGGSGFALISTQIKASVPLKFIPASYGHWTYYAGIQYYHLENEGLLDGNQALGATSDRKEDLVQLHTGISIFF